MKRFFITLAVVAAFATSAFAQADSLIVSRPDKVKVLTTGDTLSINIEGEEGNPGFYYNKSVVVDSDNEETTTTSKNIGSGLGWDFSLIEGKCSTPIIELSLKAQIYAGWTFLLGQPAGMKMKTFHSDEAGIDIFHFAFYPKSDKWLVTFDWGIVLNRYKFTKDCMLTTAPDGTVITGPYPDGSSSKSSMFHTLSGGMTLMGHYRIAKKHYIGLGAVLNEKIMDNCSYKTKYKLADGTSVTDMNELPIRNYVFGVKAEYMYNNSYGVYLRYTPMSMFRTGKAPSFQQLNLGLQVRF